MVQEKKPSRCPWLLAKEETRRVVPLVYLDDGGLVRLVRQQDVPGLGRMKTLPKCGKC